MSVLGREFATAIWLLKKYKKNVGGLELSNLNKEEIINIVDNVITELTKLQTKFRYKRLNKANEYKNNR